MQNFIGTRFADTIFLGAGSYGSIDGGAGSDTLDFANASSAETVALSGSGTDGFQGTATGLAAGFSNIDTIDGGPVPAPSPARTRPPPGPAPTRLTRTPTATH